MLSLWRKDEMCDATCTRMSELDETGEQNKKTKVVRRKLTKEEIVSILEHRKPFSMVTDWFLIRIHDLAERARYMGWVDVYYKSQEQIKREQQYIREELKTLGYVEHEVEVTDDEDDAGDNGSSSI